MDPKISQMRKKKITCYRRTVWNGGHRSHNGSNLIRVKQDLTKTPDGTEPGRKLTMLAAVSSEARDDPAALARVRARPNRKSA